MNECPLPLMRWFELLAANGRRRYKNTSLVRVCGPWQMSSGWTAATDGISASFARCSSSFPGAPEDVERIITGKWMAKAMGETELIRTIAKPKALREMLREAVASDRQVKIELDEKRFATFDPEVIIRNLHGGAAWLDPYPLQARLFDCAEIAGYDDNDGLYYGGLFLAGGGYGSIVLPIHPRRVFVDDRHMPLVISSTRFDRSRGERAG